MHSPYLTAFAASGKALEEAISPEIVYCFGKFRWQSMRYRVQKELVNKTSIYFSDYDVVLLENHGVIVGGSSVRDTYLKLELAEEYAKTLLLQNCLLVLNITRGKKLKDLFIEVKERKIVVSITLENKQGLIAGDGILPIRMAQYAKENGFEVVCISSCKR